MTNHRYWEVLRGVSIWLKSALRCKQFAWDPDQHAAAPECLNEAETLALPVEPTRELSPSEAASFDKTLARSPRRVPEKSAAEQCQHLRSELLAEKDTTATHFEMRKCLDCNQIFRKRLAVRTSGD